MFIFNYTSYQPALKTMLKIVTYEYPCHISVKVTNTRQYRELPVCYWVGKDTRVGKTWRALQLHPPSEVVQFQGPIIKGNQIDMYAGSTFPDEPLQGLLKLTWPFWRKLITLKLSSPNLLTSYIQGQPPWINV